MDSKRGTWESGIKILEKVTIIIPEKLQQVCDYIAEKVGSDEFSILTKIERIENGGALMVLPEDYYIPKQEVSAGAINYLSDENAHQYNVVIHRHPDGMHVFSSTDWDYINQNFDLSILYTHARGFVYGVYNFKMGDYLLPVEIVPKVERNMEEIDITSIAKMGFPRTYNQYGSRYTEYGAFGDGWGYEGGWEKWEKDPKNGLLQLPFGDKDKDDKPKNGEKIKIDRGTVFHETEKKEVEEMMKDMEKDELISEWFSVSADNQRLEDEYAALEMELEAYKTVLDNLPLDVRVKAYEALDKELYAMDISFSEVKIENNKEDNTKGDPSWETT